MKVVEWLGGPHDGTLFSVHPGIKVVTVNEEYHDREGGAVTVYEYEVPIRSGKARWADRKLVETRVI